MRVSADVGVRLGLELGAFVSGAPRPEDPHSNLLPGGSFLRDPSVRARKTPHRFRPKTAEPASPPGEGEERRPEDSVATDAGASLGKGGRAAASGWLRWPCVGGKGRATLTPALSLKETFA